eukprot:3592557-Rhodomonas_salina.1
MPGTDPRPDARYRPTLGSLPVSPYAIPWAVLTACHARYQPMALAADIILRTRYAMPGIDLWICYYQERRRMRRGAVLPRLAVCKL